MTIAELLLDLRGRDIHLWIERERLKCSAPVGALSAEMRATLATRKDDIRAYLRHAESLKGGPRAIVPLKPEGQRPPLFAVPGHNGDVFCYVALARHMSADQPLLGVQPPGLDGRKPLQTVYALAAYAVDQIRQFRPQGPYLLAGYCAGGTVAFEIATQLAEQGQEVALLALFGSPFPTAYRRTAQAARWLRSVGHRVHTAIVMSASLRGGITYIRTKLHRRLWQPTSDAGAARANTRRVEAATIAAIRAYRLRPYAGGIDLFLPSEGFRKSGRTALWRRVAPTLREHVGPEDCDLDLMLREPHVSATAALLRARLDAVVRVD